MTKVKKQIGSYGEQYSAHYLQGNGFHIIDINSTSRWGEIDIIAEKHGTIHFVEVKSGLDYESAIQNITSRKLSRLTKTGSVYIKKNSLNTDYMYDAVIVTPKKIWHLENITI